MLRRETSSCTRLVPSVATNHPLISLTLSASKIASYHTRGTWIRACHPKTARLFYGASRQTIITMDVVSFLLLCHCNMNAMLLMDTRGWNLFCFKALSMNNSSSDPHMQQVGSYLSTEISMCCILARMLHTVQV